ncbi:alpha/beta hydrolase [Gottschalkiaceae bacterium SANA]|nr:alpha/beta hydrolase [Gottschalkiaceae bacterium SANA]
MKPRQRLQKHALRKFVIGLLVVIALIMGGFIFYTMDYYRADPEVQMLMSRENDRIQSDGDFTSVYPNIEENKKIGLIFYPGGKVEARAYLPLLKQLSDEGITCVLSEMPFNLAVFNTDAADQVYPLYPEIDHWFLAGHSLGGAMASSYAEKNVEKLDGLILLGAYPINDADLPTIAIYGTEDIQLDIEKMRLAEEFVIDGGNHAYFGNYGEQEGDGLALISRQEQQIIAVKTIIQFLEEID